MDRKKELKEQYKSMKPPMGILAIRCFQTGSCYIKAAVNLKAAENGMRFKLNTGYYPQKTLLQEWRQYGEAGFSLETLDTLEYDKDESKTDYSEDLAGLQQIWQEKLKQDGINVTLL